MSRLPTRARKIINDRAHEHADYADTTPESNAIHDAMVQDELLETIARACAATINLESEATDRNAEDISKAALEAHSELLSAADDRAEVVAEEAAEEARELEA